MGWFLAVVVGLERSAEIAGPVARAAEARHSDHDDDDYPHGQYGRRKKKSFLGEMFDFD